MHSLALEVHSVCGSDIDLRAMTTVRTSAEPLTFLMSLLALRCVAISTEASQKRPSRPGRSGRIWHQVLASAFGRRTDFGSNRLTARVDTKQTSIKSIGKAVQGGHRAPDKLLNSMTVRTTFPPNQRKRPVSI